MKRWGVVGVAGVAGVWLAACSDPTPGGSNVIVTVYDANGLAAGAPVAFADANGHIDSTTVTDAQGRAVGHVESGASVTAKVMLYGPERPPSQREGLVTLIGLEPGDVVELGPPPPAPGPATSNVTLTFDEHPPGDFYYTGCDCGCTQSSTHASPATIAVPDTCLSAPITFAVATENGDYTTPVTATVTAGQTIAAGAWIAGTSTTVSFGSIHEPSYSVVRCSWLVCIDAGGELPATTPVAVAVPPLGPQMLDVTVDTPAYNEHTAWYVNERSIRTSVAVDAVDVPVDNGMFMGGMSAEIAHETGTVTISGGGGGDLVVLDLVTTDQHEWHVYAPDVEQLALPASPFGIGLDAPRAAWANIVTAYDFPGVDGWDSIRTHAARAFAAASGGALRSSMASAP